MASTARKSRRQHLILLIEKWKSEKRGSQKAFADFCSSNPAHVSQMKKGDREVGDAVARRIEKSFSLPEGYMDKSIDIDSKDPLDQEAATLFQQLQAESKKKGIVYLRALLQSQNIERDSGL